MVTNCNISEREFDSVFENDRECFLAAFDEGVLRVSQIVRDATERAGGWHERVRDALSVFLVFLDEEPGWAGLLLGESPLVAGPDFEQRQRRLHAIARLLACEPKVDGNNPRWFVPCSELTAELIAGGVVAVLRKRICERSREPFVELAPSLMAFIMSQYSGSNSGVNSEQSVAANESDVRLDRMPVRVTYRTTRVLAAIGDAPGLSNRDIADIAGLSDEGQTSRLLRRLEQRGLVENVGLGHTYGGANAWLLTPYGENVRDATRHSLVPGVGAVMGRRVRGAA